MLSSHDSVDLIGKNYYIFRKFRYTSSLKCLGTVFQVILANHWLLLGSWECFALVILRHFLSPQYLKCFICTVINFNVVEDRIMTPSFKAVYVLIPKICKYVARIPCSSVGKESACNAGDLGSIPGSERSPGEGNGNPLQYSHLGNPMDRGAWWATVHGFARVGHDLVTKLPPSKLSVS